MPPDLRTFEPIDPAKGDAEQTYYNYETMLNERYDGSVINEKEANYFHMLQTLTGDPTDGYKGCPNIGKVTAEKILKITLLLKILPLVHWPIKDLFNGEIFTYISIL